MSLVLIADDNAENRYLLDVLLRNNGFETATAVNGAEALDMGRSLHPDLIISDILMPVMDGFSLCREWRADKDLKTVPFVFYTATYTEQKDMDLGLSLGADRFLFKPQEVDILLEVIHEVLSQDGSEHTGASLEEEMETLKVHNEVLFRKLEKKMAALSAANESLLQEIERRKHVETELRESEEKFRVLFDTLPIGLAWTDHNGSVQFVNRKFRDLFGYNASEMATVNEWFSRAQPDPMQRAAFFSSWSEAIEKAAATGDPTPSFEVRLTCKDDSLKDVSVVGAVVGELQLAIFSDISERRKLQEQLLQAQKLENIGNLASGMAHDFNNVLTTVTGFAGLLQMKMDDAEPLQEYVKEIASAGMRGAALTHQLLAFGRKQILDVGLMDLNESIRTLQKMLRRLIREDISLTFSPCPDMLPIMADENQIGQVVINLATNAKDAMPKGGSLTISTGLAVIDNAFVRHHGYGEPGPYAVLSVTDTGIGMDAATKERIFEPFFTTKEVGKGTGLGLAVVYGIVRQHKGIVNMESQPGEGSRFDIYLPLAKEMVDAEKQHSQVSDPQNGSETILLAEDDPMIRGMASTALKSKGYNVLLANDGQAAVELFEQQGASVDILVFDLMMPRKRGFDAYMEIRRKAPGVKALFVTGYSEAEVERAELRRSALPLLLKPYTLGELLKRIRDLLDVER